MTLPNPSPGGTSLTVTLPPGCYVQPPCLNPYDARLALGQLIRAVEILSRGLISWGGGVRLRRDRIHLDPSETEQRWVLGLPGPNVSALRHLCLSLGPRMWNKVCLFTMSRAFYDSADAVHFTSCSIFISSVFLSVCLFVRSVYVSTHLAFMILGSLQAFVTKVISPTQHHWGGGMGNRVNQIK